MAKTKQAAQPAKEEKEFVITAAAIKDEFCNYEFEIKSGVGKGDIHKVKGSGIIDPELGDAFYSLCCHLAVIDDAFYHGKIAVNSIKEIQAHELSALYDVSGIKIRGEEDQEGVIITGTKSINCTGERMSIETPKILLDKHSSYAWHSHLKKAVDKIRAEVEEYKGGKCTYPAETPKEDPAQLKIGANEGSQEDSEEFLEKHRIGDKKK